MKPYKQPEPYVEWKIEPGPKAQLDWLSPDDDELVARFRNTVMCMRAEMEAMTSTHDELVARLAKAIEERDYMERERDTLLRALEGKQ